MYNVGDKVIIRSDLDTKNYGSFGEKGTCNVVRDMLKHAGKIATIKKKKECESIRGNFTGYKLDVDNGFWLWTSEMFEEQKVKPYVLFEKG